MSSDAVLILIILLVNLVVAIAYLAVHIVRKQWQRGLIVFIFMICAPVVAAVMIGVGQLVRFLWQFIGTNEINYSELSFNKERMHLLSPADIQKSLNTVAVEEALLVSDMSARRETFINLLKDDSYENALPLIRRSVENTDPEVAHYAASYVSSTVVAYKDKEAAYYSQLQANTTVDLLRKYLNHVALMARSNFFTALELNIYDDKFIQIAETYHEYAADQITDQELPLIIDVLGIMNRPKERSVWVDRCYERAWVSLTCFKACARYYYDIKDKNTLFRLIDESKRHSLVLDKEALDWVRIFNTEAIW